MRILGVLLLSLCLFAACGQKHDHKGKTPLVEVAGQFLYKDDLLDVTPVGLSSDDSLLFVEHYIRDWVEDALLYEKAKNNIPDNGRIDDLVDNYRKALIVHTYQQNMIEQRLENELSESDLKTYYESNKGLFLVDRPLIRGVFLKIPLKSSGISQVRQWCRQNILQNRDKVEKYSFQHAIEYEYFYDRWCLAMDMADKMPINVDELLLYLEKDKSIELKDSANFYFLHVEEWLKTGEQEPYEFAKAEIRDILINLKRVTFMQHVKDELFDDASKHNRIIYYEN